MPSYPKEVSVSEVGPRDGLQIEAIKVATADKIDLVERLVASGIKKIEVSAFVHPKVVPQLADAEQVCGGRQLVWEEGVVTQEVGDVGARVVAPDLDSGRLQARAGGGLAGHNGLRSLAQALGTQDFLRLRIGVGRLGRGEPRSVADYVLSPFELEEDVGALVSRSADAVETLAREGVEAAQQRFN